MGDWRLVLPPSRPSEAHLRLVDEVCSRLPRTARVAILGSTPEYRELLYRRGFESIYVFERNLDFFQFSSNLAQVSPEEILVEGDWLDTLSDFRNHFDAVFSHLTSGNISYDSREHYYQLIAQSLRSSGQFADFVLTNETGYFKRDDILENFLDTPVNIVTANEFSCHAVFCSEYAETLGVVDTEQIYDALHRDLPARIHPLIELAQSVTPRGGLWYYGKPWSEIVLYHSEWLDVSRSVLEQTGSYYCGRARHNIMTKKK